MRRDDGKSEYMCREGGCMRRDDGESECMRREADVCVEMTGKVNVCAEKANVMPSSGK
jgi:hypothetical protein